jgi:NTP pyrophosphatase (non-canonical NTP hydrolase)
MADILSEIRAEREQQDAKWGEQNHQPADWATILVEEVGEVAKAALEWKFAGRSLRLYRDELVQVAAVAVAMIECYDRQVEK